MTFPWSNFRSECWGSMRSFALGKEHIWSWKRCGLRNERKSAFYAMTFVFTATTGWKNISIIFSWTYICSGTTPTTCIFAGSFLCFTRTTWATGGTPRRVQLAGEQPRKLRKKRWHDVEAWIIYGCMDRFGKVLLRWAARQGRSQPQRKGEQKQIPCFAPERYSDTKEDEKFVSFALQMYRGAEWRQSLGGCPPLHVQIACNVT